MDDTPVAAALPQAETPDPAKTFDLHKVASNLDEAGACFQGLAAKSQKQGDADKAQNFRDLADVYLDGAQFLRSIVGLVTVEGPDAVEG